MAPLLARLGSGRTGFGFRRKRSFQAPNILVGSRAIVLTGSYQSIDYDDGDAISALKTGYYSFRIRGGRSGGSGSQGGLTEGSIYLVVNQNIYIKDIFTGYARTGGYGVYLGNTNSLDPVSNRPSSTILVVGGGGYRLSSNAGSGGGLEGGGSTGEAPPNGSPYVISGGTQTGGGPLWFGGNGGGGSQGWGPGGGGGHGWYGGGGAGGDNQGGHGSGGGGSGYISSILTTPNTHGHLGAGATTIQGGADWPQSTEASDTMLEMKIV